MAASVKQWVPEGDELGDVEASPLEVWFDQLRTTRPAQVARRYLGIYKFLSTRTRTHVVKVVAMMWLIWFIGALLGQLILGPAAWFIGALLALIGAAATVILVGWWIVYNRTGWQVRHRLLAAESAARGREISREVSAGAVVKKAPQVRPKFTAAVKEHGRDNVLGEMTYGKTPYAISRVAIEATTQWTHQPWITSDLSTGALRCAAPAIPRPAGDRTPAPAPVKPVAEPGALSKVAHFLLTPAGTPAPGAGDHDAPKRPRATDVGFRLGSSYGESMWVSIERPVYVVGPARSGKGVNIIISAIIEAPGAVITTSTRSENMRAAAACRAAVGPVYSFNLDKVGGIEHTIRWSPLEGCEDPEIAQARAKTLVASSGLGGENAVWAKASGQVVQALLHAAAISGGTIDDVYRWSRSPNACDEAMDILRKEGNRAGGRMDRWETSLEELRRQDTRSQTNKWLGVDQAFEGLAVHEIRQRLAVRPTDPGYFNTGEFLRSRGTVFMMARGTNTVGEGGGVGGFYSLFLDHVTEVAAELAQSDAKAGGRCDPPLTLVLDELAHIHPWPGAARMSAEGSGVGIQMMVIFQSREQAAEAYGEKKEQTMWGNCMNVILGGGKSEFYARALSSLIGDREREKQRESWSTAGGLVGNRTVSVEGQWRPDITPNDMRRLPQGTGLIIESSLNVIICDFTPFWHRGHKHCIDASLDWHEKHAGKVLASVIEVNKAHDTREAPAGAAV